MKGRILDVNMKIQLAVGPQSWAQLNRSGLLSETLKCGSLEGGESAGSTEGTHLCGTGDPSPQVLTRSDKRVIKNKG
jgi:hypothetical protein